MTKHTATALPLALGERTSTLSLRAALAASSFVPYREAGPQVPAEPQTPPSLTLESRLLQLAGTPHPHKAHPVCGWCALALRPDERSHISEPGMRRCVVCALKDGKAEAFTRPFCEFLTENPTVFHAVAHFGQKLGKAGYEELPARADWTDKIVPGGKYYVSRNGSSLVAFNVGKAYKPGNGAAMVAAHVDALTARLKPVSTKASKSGFVQLGVVPYGGALAATWWDRDLGIAGRVIVRDPETGKTSTKLVKLDWPIAKIPTLAPHFGSPIMGSGNKETQAVPIIGLDKYDADGEPVAAEPLGPAGSFAATQPPRLVQLIAAELGITSYSSILNWELELFDSQPADVVGLDKELLSAGRIDDKLCSWAALLGLLLADDAADDGTIRLAAFFDDEEIGSLLRQGARGNFLPLTLERIVEALSTTTSPTVPFGPGLLGRTYAASFLVSADVTHAAHPNFPGAYEPAHAPRLNVGVALKADGNGSTTTDAASAAVVRRAAELSGSAVQVFMARNDSRGGGTVGPMLSAALGCRAADAGLPQLSMHSIRATTGALDPGLGVKFFRGFYENWEKVDKEWQP